MTPIETAAVALVVAKAEAWEARKALRAANGTESPDCERLPDGRGYTCLQDGGCRCPHCAVIDELRHIARLHRQSTARRAAGALRHLAAVVRRETARGDATLAVAASEGEK